MSIGSQSALAGINHEAAPGPGWRVVTAPGFGRVVVAERAFAAGEVVMAEPPVLKWPTYNGDDLRTWAAMAAAFTSASPAARAIVLDMARPPPSSAAERACRLTAQAVRARLGGARCALSEADIAGLILISNTNAHTWRGTAEWGVASMTLETSSSMTASHTLPGAQEYSVLFEAMSKVAHSCAPNAAYSSRQGGGLGTYVALRSIAKGEQVSFTYIAEEAAMPRAERRAQLLSGKGFVCRCARCCGPDDCRGILCKAPSCAGIMLHDDDETDVLPGESTTALAVAGAAAARARACLWRCSACQVSYAGSSDAMAKCLSDEARVRARTDALDATYRSGRLLTGGPAAFREALADALTVLAPTHHLVLRLLSTCADWATGTATTVQRCSGLVGVMRAPWGGGGPVTEAALVGLSARAGAACLALLECLQAGCVRVRCGKAHAPHSTAQTLFVVQDLERADRAVGGAAAARLAARYLPSLARAFGTGDTDVLRLQRLVDSGVGVSAAAVAALPLARVAVASVFCGHCGQGEKAGAAGIAALKPCSGCRCVFYCDSEHQRADWAPRHKQQCKALRSAAERYEEGGPTPLPADA